MGMAWNKDFIIIIIIRIRIIIIIIMCTVFGFVPKINVFVFVSRYISRTPIHFVVNKVIELVSYINSKQSYLAFSLDAYCTYMNTYVRACARVRVREMTTTKTKMTTWEFTIVQCWSNARYFMMDIAGNWRRWSLSRLAQEDIVIERLQHPACVYPGRLLREKNAPSHAISHSIWCVDYVLWNRLPVIFRNHTRFLWL